jgi:hypothetical protein
MGWCDVLAASVAARGPVLVRAASSSSGVSVRAIRARARREGWWQPYPDVIAVPGSPQDGRAWALAAALHAAGRTGDADRDLAAVTRSSALAVLGLQRSYPTRTTVVVPASRWLAARDRLVVLRSTLLRPDDVVVHDGVPVTTGFALVRDLAAVRERAALRRAVVDLAHAGHVDVDRLAATLVGSRRFRGIAIARAAIADLVGAGRTDSPLEFDVRTGLAAAGIPLDRGQVAIPRTAIHVDLGIAAIRFGIEVDSLAHHGDRRSLERDAARANLIAEAEADWRVLHATWATLGEGWDRFVAQVREVVAAQARRHLGLPWPPPSAIR